MDKQTQALIVGWAKSLVTPQKEGDGNNPYECHLVNANERISFGDNYSFTNCGTIYNYQPVIVDGSEVATLEEIYPWSPFEPIGVRFYISLSDEEGVRLKKHPAFRENFYGYPELSFKTLQDLIDYLGLK